MPEIVPPNIGQQPVQEIITFFRSMPDDQFFQVPYEVLSTLPREAQEAIVLDGRDRQERLNAVLETRNRATGIGVGTPEEIQAARQAQPVPGGVSGGNVLGGAFGPATRLPPGGTTAPRGVGGILEALGGSPQPQAPQMPPGGSIEQGPPLLPPGPQAMGSPQNARILQALMGARV